MSRRIPYDHAGYLTKKEKQAAEARLEIHYKNLSRATKDSDKADLLRRIKVIEGELQSDKEVRIRGQESRTSKERYVRSARRSQGSQDSNFKETKKERKSY